MSNAAWDKAAFKASILDARQNVEFAARFIESGPSRPRWESHRPVIELMFYLCKLDYDIKVLLFQFCADPENRTVWERHLALELHEALQTLPKAINRARKELARPDTASHLDLARFDTAAKSYRQEVKAINEDKDFMNALKVVRNRIAAHHGLSHGQGLETSIAWTLNAWKLTQSETTPFDSQVGEYAVRLGRAIQDFGKRIRSHSTESLLACCDWPDHTASCRTQRSSKCTPSTPRRLDVADMPCLLWISCRAEKCMNVALGTF